MRSLRTARFAGALLVGGALLLTTTSCLRRGRPVEPGLGSFWLASTGFPDRADWPSTVAHLGREELGGIARLTLALDDVPRLALRPPRADGWGVYLTDEAGELLCEVDVWLNGVHQYRDPRGTVESVDALLPGREFVSAVELHEGAEGPVQEPDGCGALLVWSEERAQGWNPPFRGRVVGRVTGNLADTVAAVQLVPDGQRLRPDRAGRYELTGVLPGLHEVDFLTADGSVLFRRTARVYAFSDTHVNVDVSR